MAMISVAKPRVILCDIEGTTTAITFVKDVLFPYVRAHLREYLQTTWTSSQTRQDVNNLWEQYQLDCSLPAAISLPTNLPNFSSFEEKDQPVTQVIIDAISAYVSWAMDLDRKTTALKTLQGNIWRDGYASGALKAHVYDEIPVKFKQWTEDEAIKLAIYSSGSVLAQKLLFRYTTAGDLTKYISGYFDTKVGAKQEVTSYLNISSELKIPPKEFLFLTDIEGEARAAIDAGMNAIILLRSEESGELINKADQKQVIQIVNNFNQIVFL